jgi:signal transduction histidine kinase
MAPTKWRTRLAIAGLAVVLAAILAFLFAKTQGYDESSYFENVARLREIAHLDAHWELAALHSRVGINSNYDPLAGPLPHLDRLQAELASHVDVRGSGNSPALVQGVAALGRAIAEKTRLMEHFKSHNAVLRNSLAFLPVAARDLRRSAGALSGGAARAAQRVSKRADAVLLAVFIHAQQGGDASAAEIDTALLHLAAETSFLPTAIGDRVDLFASHVRAALREHAAVTGLLNRVAAVPIDAHVDAIDGLLSDRHLRAAAEDQRYGRYLLAFAALLTALLVAAALSLVRSHGLIRRVNRQLQEANECLEQRVRERTRELHDAQAELVATARQAGMAEIATNVLHNVGNVLNSVNVSASLVGGRVRDSKAAGLARAVHMMNEHAADLGDFLTHDEKGRRLPEYLHKLAEALTAEQAGILDELGQLTRSVDHIKDIVATQQSYAGASRLVEPVDVRDLVDDALRMNAGALMRHDVSVIKEIAEVPVLPLDRHRVLQILVNLISNAKHAMDATPDRPHRMTLRVAMADGAAGRSLHICVADEGEGIPADNLARIFTHGFTTRKNGHGFGLHSCALAAREMDGTLTAHSAGPGLGAAFTLELPVKAEGIAA